MSIPGAALPSQQPPPAQVTAQPYQNPFGPAHRQAYQQPYPRPHQQQHQQPSYLAPHPFDPAWPKPPHQTPSFLPQGGIQSQMLHPAFRSLRPGGPDSGASEKKCSLPPPSLEPGLLAPAMDTNRDVAHVARESETYSERMKRLGAERQAETQAGESVQQAADAGEQSTDLRSREDSVFRGDVDSSRGNSIWLSAKLGMGSWATKLRPRSSLRLKQRIRRRPWTIGPSSSSSFPSRSHKRIGHASPPETPPPSHMKE